jgi:hypothetical protein
LKLKELNALTALLRFLVLLAFILPARYAHVFTSLSPAAGNQVQLNHLICFEESMSKPTNKPSCEPSCKPTNEEMNDQPIKSNNAFLFNDKPSSTHQLVVASITKQKLTRLNK